MFKKIRLVSPSFSLIASLFAMSSLSSCAFVNSVSLTPIPSQRSHPVKAEASKTIFLGFNFDNDYVDGIVRDLKQQCPNGIVSGILTKDETIAYVIVFKRHVIATGFCNTAPAESPEKTSKKPRKDKV